MGELTWRLPPPLFRDRKDAGRQLGARLREQAWRNPVVLGVPAGGVPVAVAAAQELGAPLDLLIARKIQYPWNPEAGFGAVAADGTVYLSGDASALPPTLVEQQKQLALQQVEQRAALFRDLVPPVELQGHDVILVDDGLASGATMLTAVRVVRRRRPRRVIVAVPTASGAAAELIAPHVDQLVALYVHPRGMPFAVASSYEQWYDLTDDEVRQLLARTGEE